jgi:hypothetical protein
MRARPYAYNVLPGPELRRAADTQAACLPPRNHVSIGP